MREKYLGDSYDVVKRFWAESLATIAPLYAHPQFVSCSLSHRFATLTKIPLLQHDDRPKKFGLLLDPNTGIPWPCDGERKVTADHAPLNFLLEVWNDLEPVYAICFDQSYHRRHELTKREQLQKKQAFLQENNIHSFYYHSHAPFLFMTRPGDCIAQVTGQLVSVGIPESRLISL